MLLNVGGNPCGSRSYVCGDSECGVCSEICSIAVIRMGDMKI